jgi:hypothetical protein
MLPPFDYFEHRSAWYVSPKLKLTRLWLEIGRVLCYMACA